MIFKISFNINMDYYLSGNDITNVLGRDNVKILTYDDIYKYNDIHDLFFDETDMKLKDAIALLYIHTTGENGQKIGHWNALIRYDTNMPYGEKSILFFDSYGDEPDVILKRISSPLLKKYHEDHNYLNNLFYYSGYPIQYNNQRLQGSKTATCGRWVCAIIKLKYLTIDQFDKIFAPYKNISPDKLVLSYITL